MKRHFILLLFVFIGWFYPIQLCFSQKINFKKSITHSSIPFQFIQNLVIVEIRINDSGPLNFILDSGVGPLIITDSLLVDSLHAGNSFLYRIQGRGIGPEIEAYLINGIKVDIGKHASGYLTAVLLKNEPFRLSLFLGIPIHGIIGSDFFESFMVNVNYSTKKVKFYSFDARVKKRGVLLPIQIIAGKPYADFEIEKEDGRVDTLLLLIDTGAGHALSLDLSDEHKAIQPQLTIPANLGVGLSGPINGYIGRLKRITFGSLGFNNIITAFPQYEDEELRSVMTLQHGSVGGEFLKRFNVFFDYSRNELYLKKNRLYKRPFEYDMTGIEIYTIQDEGATRFFISRVEEGSPAAQQGVMVDDELLFINFKDVKRYSLNEIYGMFKKETGTGLFIQLRRGDEILFKFLNLKRRI